MNKVCVLSAALLVLAFRGDASGQAGRPDQALAPPFRSWHQNRIFKAGERACFVAVGSGISYLGGYVYDEEGNCVAWDDQGSPPTRDDIALVWYPPRTGRYTIELVNFGRRRNVFEFAIRQ